MQDIFQLLHKQQAPLYKKLYLEKDFEHIPTGNFSSIA